MNRDSGEWADAQWERQAGDTGFQGRKRRVSRPGPFGRTLFAPGPIWRDVVEAGGRRGMKRENGSWVIVGRDGGDCATVVWLAAERG